MAAPRAISHERDELRAHSGHVRREEHRVIAADVLEADARTGQGALVGDGVAGERNAMRPLRERRLWRIGCEHDHDVLARRDERTERPVEERDAVQRLDVLRPTEASGGAAGEEDAGGSAHPGEISTTAL